MPLEPSAPDKIVASPTVPIYLLVDDGVTSDGLEYEGFEPCLDEECTKRLELDKPIPNVPLTFYSRVAGVSHRPTQLQLPGCAAGSVVLLMPEPTNPADSNAVRVVVKSEETWTVVGYMPAGLVTDSTKVAPGGAAMIVQAFSRNGQRVGLRIVGTFGRALTMKYRIHST